MQKVLVISGPTATGKSDLARYLAKELNGEIISGDSIQVYRGLDIGSAKETEAEQAEVPHHLIDILDPQQRYSVKDFQLQSRRLIAEIAARGRLPIIAEGTGLYIRACLYDYVFEEEEGEDDPYPALSNQELYQRLQELDPKALEKIHPNNRKRLLRAYNVCRKSGMPFSANDKAKGEPLYDALIIGLTMEREELYARIDRRVEAMAAAGLKEEIAGLLSQGVDFSCQSMQGIGYKEYKEYFSGEKSEEECLQLIKSHTHHFVKRQYTWFRHQLNVSWHEPQEREKIRQEVETWLKN